MNRKPTMLMMAYTYYQSDPRVIREAEAAVRAGFEVDFLALRRANEPQVEDIRGVRVYHLGQSKYRGKGHLKYLLSYLEFFIRCFFKTTCLCLRRRYRLIHVNNMPDFLVFSTLGAKLLGAKVLLDIHDPMPNTFASKFKSGEGGFFYRLLLWQERISVWYANRTLTVHEPVKVGVLAKHGLRPDSIVTVANFADDDLFQLRQSYGVADKVRLVFHGTILERSGLRTLLTALSLSKHQDRLEVRIIGEGDFSPVLKELIVGLGLEEMVHFDNHSYPVHEIPKLLAQSDVGLVPLAISSITNYALPLKLLEYISMGLPVITVRSEAICYYFKEEDCLFYQWDEPSSLAAVIDRVAENPEILMAYHRKAVALREKFRWSTEKEKYGALLRELAGAPQALGLEARSALTVDLEPTNGERRQEGALPPMVSVVIVSWNAREYLLQCLESLFTQACRYAMEVIVVDNASSDGSAEVVAARYPKVRLIRNAANLGFAKANNAGIRASAGRYVCLVNSDVKVVPQCIDRLVDYCEAHPEVGMVGPRVLGGDGHLQRSCRGFPSVWNMFCRALALDTLFPGCKWFTGYSLWHWPQDSLRPVSILTGCFWLVRQTALAEVGLLDEAFFMYGEDMDWCKRFWDAHWQVMFVPAAEAIHYGGASSANAPLRFYIERHRADLQYWKKHHSLPAVACYVCLTCLHLLVRGLGYSLVALVKREPGQPYGYKVRRSFATLRWLLTECLVARGNS